MDTKHPILIATLLIVMAQGSSVSVANQPIDFEKAEQYKQQGKFNKANWIYFASLKNNTNVTESHYGLADSFYRNGQNDEALHRIEKVLNLDSNHVQALKLRSRIYVHQRHWEEALNDLELMQSLGDNSSELFMSLESVHSALGNLQAANLALRAAQQRLRDNYAEITKQ